MRVHIRLPPDVAVDLRVDRTACPPFRPGRLRVPKTVASNSAQDEEEDQQDDRYDDGDQHRFGNEVFGHFLGDLGGEVGL